MNYNLSKKDSMFVKASSDRAMAHHQDAKYAANIRIISAGISLICLSSGVATGLKHGVFAQMPQTMTSPLAVTAGFLFAGVAAALCARYFGKISRVSEAKLKNSFEISLSKALDPNPYEERGRVATSFGQGPYGPRREGSTTTYYAP